jgi:hypothetical protein
MKMMRRRTAEPPQGVEIIAPDGTVIPCSVLRDESLDEDGCAAWLVVPISPLVRMPGEWHLSVKVLPGKTRVLMCPVPERG